MPVARLQAVAAAAVILLAVGSRADAACRVGAAANATFPSVTSFAVQSAPQTTSTLNAGLSCSGSTLTVLRSDDHVYLTITSANGGLRGPGGDMIAYGAYGTAGTTYPIPFGTPFNYARTPLIDLLGLFGGPSAIVPLHFRTAAGSNVAAGTYTDTLTLAWSWNYCSGIGLLGVCTERDVGSGSTTLQVSATITNACQVTAAPSIMFGQASTASSFLPVSQSIAVLCTKALAAYSVALDAGLHAAGGRRRMASGGSFLEYDIFSLPTMTRWGSADGQRVPNGSAANGITPQLFPYRASVYGDQRTPPVGRYVDTVIVTVTF